MKQILPFIIMIIVLVIIAVLVINLMNYRLKKRILDSEIQNQISLDILKELTGNGNDIIKWALILIFGGIGLILIEFLPFSASDSTLPYGVETVFVGLGFFLYHLILRSSEKNKH